MCVVYLRSISEVISVLQAQRIDQGYWRYITTCLSFFVPAYRVKMGSSVARLAPLLLLGLISSVWSLNPDDPNVCSHWERWALSTRLYILHCCTSSISQGWHGRSWNFLNVPATNALNLSSTSILKVQIAVSISHSSSRQAQSGGRGCSFRWNTQANWSVYSHPNQSCQP